MPQVSAVWSADPRQMRSFPVRFLAEFFANHGMLGFRDRPRWSTVAGGSARYVEALTRAVSRAHPPRRAGALDRPRTRTTSRSSPAAAGGARERFDQVVIATHSDQALALLRDPSERERELLGAIPYQRNEAVLHTDSALLPRRRGARAAWNFHLLREPKPLSTVTYYMNHLQRLRRRPRLLRDAEPHRGDRPGEDHPHDLLLPPRLHARGRRRAGPARERSAAWPRARTTAAPTGAGASTRTACVSALRACEPFGVTL